MPKYQTGDSVIVDGLPMVIRSWPDTDEGPFVAVSTDNRGQETWHTLWAGVAQMEGEPIHSTSTIELVAAGDGEQSTAGEVPGVDETDTDAPAETVEEPAADEKAAK